MLGPERTQLTMWGPPPGPYKDTKGWDHRRDGGAISPGASTKDTWTDFRTLSGPWGPACALCWAKDPQLDEVSQGLWPKTFADRGSYMLQGKQELEAESGREPGLSTPLPLCTSQGRHHPPSQCMQASPHASSHSAGASCVPWDAAASPAWQMTESMIGSRSQMAQQVQSPL